jgi:hypothetical protein
MVRQVNSVESHLRNDTAKPLVAWLRSSLFALELCFDYLRLSMGFMKGADFAVNAHRKQSEYTLKTFSSIVQAIKNAPSCLGKNYDLYHFRYSRIRFKVPSQIFVSLRLFAP